MDNDSANFCFIVGSFARTAPHLRDASSDVDIIANNVMSEDEIKILLFSKYPHLGKLQVPLDISFRHPVNNSITYRIAYWQKPDFISLIPETKVTLDFVITERNVPNCLRDPNKEEFAKYVRTNTSLDFYKLKGLWKAVRHYGYQNMYAALENIPDRETILAIFEMAKDPSHGDVCLSITDRPFISCK
jgi:hypothetical protein